MIFLSFFLCTGLAVRKWNGVNAIGKCESEAFCLFIFFFLIELLARRNISFLYSDGNNPMKREKMTVQENVEITTWIDCE